MKFYKLYFSFILLILAVHTSLAQTHYQEILRYPNKNIQSIRTFNNQEILDGETVFFYPNENIKTVLTYVNGKANGIIENYYNYGILESSGLLIDDLAEGVFEYYHENGAKKQKIYYVNNKIMGIDNCYTYRKEKVYCGVVNNGNGFINIYDKKGKLIAKDIIKNGEMLNREYIN